MAELLNIEVVYAVPDSQDVICLSLPVGSTVQQAIEMSGVLNKFPELDLRNLHAGIFSRLTRLDAVLREQDRVEIYRPLRADPKEVRRQRAAVGKGMKKGGRDRLPVA